MIPNIFPKRVLQHLIYRYQVVRGREPDIHAKNYHSFVFPQRVDIGITDACNEKCVMCPNPALPKPRGFMKDETFHKIIDELAMNDVKDIGLGLFGEPTLHKNLKEFIRYANAKDIEINMSTNGISLSQDLSEFLVCEAKGRLHISLYAADAKSFKDIHGVDAFDTVVRNTKHLLNLMKNSPQTGLLIFMNFLDTNGDSASYQAWKAQWIPLLEQVPHLKSYLKKYITWGGRVDEKNNVGSGRQWSYHKPCEKIQSRVAIDWNGRVTACCKSWNEPSLNIGDINENSLSSIWNGERMRSIRAAILRQDWKILKSCEHCDETTAKLQLY